MSIQTISYNRAAAGAGAVERATFIRKTYLHLAFAVLGFIGIEYALMQSALGPAMLEWLSAGQYRWLAILGGFMLATWVARGLATSSTSPALQYLGFAGYIAAEALIFLPLLMIAAYYSSPKVLPMAAIMTGMLFGGLTITALITRSDFSFLRTFLVMGTFIAFGLIICSILFGFELGMVFSGGMVIFAMAAILYDTGKILNNYPTDRHVGASIELFASVALLFWYVLRLMMAVSRR